MTTLDIIAQIGITVFGLTAIILVARKNKWGFIFGILSVPFWFITSISNGQWGVTLLNVAYAITWIYGAYNWFLGGNSSASREK